MYNVYFPSLKTNVFKNVVEAFINLFKDKLETTLELRSELRAELLRSCRLLMYDRSLIKSPS